MMWDVGELREDVFLKFDFEKNRILVNRGYSVGYVRRRTKKLVTRERATLKNEQQ